MLRSGIILFFALLGALSLHAQSVDGLRVAWDRSSESRIAPHGNYARVIRLEDDTFLAAFEHGGGISLATSADLKAWSSPRPVISGFQGSSGGHDYHVHTANPELCLTRDGTLLLGVNYRPSGHAFYPFSIVLLRSEDGGFSWSSPDVLYCAGLDFSDGCWEPSFLQLPDGTIHLYFANEGPYTDSQEQEISVMTSCDDGRSWSPAITASFRSGHRDGMPVATVVGDDIVLAIEDNVDGKFKPYTVRASLEEGWTEPVGGCSPLRLRALSAPVERHVYMGAPYIVTLPGGETLLSYQTTEGRSNEWEFSCMEVAVSDSAAEAFSKRTRPFDVPFGRSGKWNSLCVVDANTVAAVSSTDKDGVNAPHIVQGHLIRSCAVSKVSHQTDHFFVGSMTCDNLTAGLGYEGGQFVFRACVKDADVTEGDGVEFFLDLTGKESSAPYKGVFKVYVDHTGSKVKVFEGHKGAWKPRPSSSVSVQSIRESDGYSLTVVFRERTFRAINADIRASVLHINDASDGTSYMEPLVHSDPDIPSTWLAMYIL